ncbi:MAG: cell division ATP-binding protein FtsE [Acutalibacteraceae bacterium]
MIEFRGVHKTYDNGTKALRDVNITIDKGEFVFIVGASGAGKSTFLKLIMHEEVPNAGEVIVNGYKLSKLKRREIPYLRRTMGIVFQDFRLIHSMTVFDNVAFAMRVTGASKREVRKRVPYILGLVGLQDKARNFPMELSGGEQQRVSLARALVNNPSLIIADEPTGNIDPELSFEIMELLTEINRRGTTVLVVTHEHELVEHFHRRVIVIDSGTVVSDVPQDDSYAENAAPAENGVVSDVLDTIQTPDTSGSKVDAVIADIMNERSTNGGDAQ